MKKLMICSIEGCKSESKARGLCYKHYKRWQRHGDPEVVLMEQNKNRPETCIVVNCNNKHLAKGYCEKHHKRWLRHGDASLTLKTPNGTYEKCTKEGCENAHYGKGLCEKHLTRKRYSEDPELRKKAFMYSKKRKAKLLKVQINDFTLKEWISIKEKFNHECAYCDNQTKKLEQEHIKPLSRSGNHTAKNIIPACRQCNQNKYNKCFFEWYPNYKYYSKEREQKILKHLGYEDKKQQLALF